MSDAKLEALANTTLFSSCSKKHLKAIGMITDRVTLAPGRVLVKHGSVPTEMAILISGKAEVEVNGRVLAELGPGDVIGELALIDSERASATVTITDDAEAWLVSHAGFKPVWEQNPEMSTTLLQAVATRLRAANEFST